MAKTFFSKSKGIVSTIEYCSVMLLFKIFHLTLLYCIKEVVLLSHFFKSLMQMLNNYKNFLNPVGFLLQ